ncbi:DUF4145 domain-containing protein [Nocardia yamanashiensis]|uniref:DUF4145 domain-containing protein n=1 Tax=Nocardia yamanashiensis TaxID=209247 RepID=UPI0014723451|nr:DUF4145 domain-containing protein [Nocardia yamanashiensis]
MANTPGPHSGDFDPNQPAEAGEDSRVSTRVTRNCETAKIRQGTCADQGATKRVLAENLKELQAQGKIDGLLAQWADLLRVVGNKGAHLTGEKVSAQDAQDALDFAEALLDHIYVLRARFDAFKARRHT